MTERILGDSLGLLLGELRKRSFLFAGTAGAKRDVSLELLGRRQGLLLPWGQVLPESVASDRDRELSNAVGGPHATDPT